VVKKMKLEIQLSQAESEQIRDFWLEHGAAGGAMISQPVSKYGRYLLRVRMLDPEQAEEVSQCLGLQLKRGPESQLKPA
jgi:hypothetical protein